MKDCVADIDAWQKGGNTLLGTVMLLIPMAVSAGMTMMNEKGEFDLVIADLKMPGLDGIELLESLKRFDEDIPVIIITAYGTVEAAVETINKGAFDFITKPFRKEQILFTIEKALKWLRLQRENKMLKEKLGKG
jgi:DNA-binding NtrC family response regulator